MSYPGNSSLARETQEKILSTFSQTLELASAGRLQEAALGCDFILKMDRMFEPARALQARLQGASGPIDVADLSLEPVPSAPEPSGPQDNPMVVELVDDPSLPSLEGGVGALEEEPVPLLELPSEIAPVAPTMPAAASAPTAEEPVPLIAADAGAPAASSDDRIAELLQEGQTAFDQGEYQNAIDAWSRIFLIDIDHSQATELIESARQLKAEQERQVDELMGEATKLRADGKTEEARAAFQRVLELHPNHLAAKEYLQTLDQPTAAEPVAASFKPPPSSAASPGADAVFSGELPSLEELSGTLEQPEEDISSVSTSIAGRSGSVGPDRSVLRIGVPVFVLLLVAGWLIYANWGRIFKNTSEPPPPPQRPSVVQQANRLHLDGNTADAIAMLEQVLEGSPDYDRAQLLIERWREELAEVEANDVADSAPPEEDVARQQALLERARRLYDEGEYLEAAKSFQAASNVLPLEGASADLYEDTKQQLLPIASQIALFRQREWEMVLPIMWRRLQEEPGNRDVLRLLVNTYYNLGVRALRRGEPVAAGEQFREIIKLGVDDPLAERLLLFSETYTQYPEDLLYRIYVGQLKYRR